MAQSFEDIFLAIGRSQKSAQDVEMKRWPELEKAYDNEFISFNQEWSSTALGFNLRPGLAGQAFTSATTCLYRFGRIFLVYFDGRFAYKFKMDQGVMENHIWKHNMPSQRGVKQYAYFKDVEYP